MNDTDSFFLAGGLEIMGGWSDGAHTSSSEQVIVSLLHRTEDARDTGEQEDNRETLEICPR